MLPPLKLDINRGGRIVTIMGSQIAVGRLVGRRLAAVLFIAISVVVSRAEPANAVCGPASPPQMFAGAWQPGGTWWVTTIGTRASVRRAPNGLENDTCTPTPYGYYIATAHQNIGSGTYVEWGVRWMRQSNGTYALDVYRSAVLNYTVVFSEAATVSCSSLNGSYVRLMAEIKSGTTWWGGINCSNSNSSMSYATDFNAGLSYGYSLTETERLASTSVMSATPSLFTNLAYWDLNNTMKSWAQIRCWGDVDPDYYIGAASATQWTLTYGPNPPGYLCSSPY